MIKWRTNIDDGLDNDYNRRQLLYRLYTEIHRSNYAKHSARLIDRWFVQVGTISDIRDLYSMT